MEHNACTTIRERSGSVDISLFRNTDNAVRPMIHPCCRTESIFGFESREYCLVCGRDFALSVHFNLPHAILSSSSHTLITSP